MNSKIAVVSLLISIAVITVAYDFDDSLFNQILVKDLEELHNSLDEDSMHYRSRRDEDAVSGEKCKSSKKKKFCCAEETFEEMHEKDKEQKKECFKQLKESGDFDPLKCDKTDKHKKDILCVYQCVGQKKNVLDEAGNPKEKEFEAFVKEAMLKESWFSAIQDKVIPACLAEARNATTNHDSCNPAGVKLAHCLFREIQMACPAEQIKDQKACSRARDKIRRHNDLFAPPAPYMNDE